MGLRMRGDQNIGRSNDYPVYKANDVAAGVSTDPVGALSALCCQSRNVFLLVVVVIAFSQPAAKSNRPSGKKILGKR